MFASKTAKTNSHSPPSGTNNLFVQPTLKTGSPGDKYEVEADHVADQVVANVKDSQISNDSFFTPTNSIQQKSFFGANAPVIQQSVEEDELKLSAKEDEEVSQGKTDLNTDESGDNLVQTELNAIQAKIETQTENEELQEKEEEEEEAVQTKSFIQKIEDEQAPEEELQLVQAKLDSGGNSTSIESDLNNSSGGGSSMSDSTRSEMESGFGTDFSNVNIHTDSNAVQMSENIGAQAFAHGNDIYFNEGKYNPGTDSGKHLLAHELTHTVQQGASVQAKMIQKVDGETEQPSESESTTGTIGNTSTGQVDNINRIITYSSIPITGFKTVDHRGIKYSSYNLKRHKRYSGSREANNVNQRDIWRRDINTATIESTLSEKFNQASGVETTRSGRFDIYAFKVRESERGYLTGTLNNVVREASIPKWNDKGESPAYFQVDHIVEMQISGYPGEGSGSVNEIDNMELLTAAENSQSGTIIRESIENKVQQTINDEDSYGAIVAEIPSIDSQQNVEDKVSVIKNNYHLVFNSMVPGGGPANIGSDKYWKQDQIERGVHLDHLIPISMSELGSADSMLIFPRRYHPIATPFSWDGANQNPTSSERRYFSPWVIVRKNFINDENSEVLGHFDLEYPSTDPLIRATGGQVEIKKLPGAQFAGYVDNVEGISGSRQAVISAGNVAAKQFSPVRLDTIDFNDGGVIIEGKVLPTMGLIDGAELDLTFQNGEVMLSKTFVNDEFSFPSPFILENSSLVIFASSSRGLGIEGQVDFGINNVGEGHIGAAASTGEGFELEGAFNFDSELFDPAEINVEYKDNIWTIGGEIGIPEGKVRGVKNATITASYSENNFTATGEAELDIPGIERGTMTVNYGDEGFSISGNFDLSSDIPGIRSGNVEARVAKEEGAENYDVMVSGTAEPDIPGIDSSLTVTYENGAITIEGRASYERGMLSGNVNIGATNRTIGEDGEPTGEPDDTMRVYGGGDLTLQLTPWLEATAGVQFLPNGEIEVTGRIALPSTVDVFDRKEFRRSLFTVPTIEIPIFAIPLGPRSIGLVAQISGGLDFSAGFGPGQLREVAAEVTYNPDHEDETQITGHGEFAIPADAGLTLRGDLGLGVSIAIASLSGGIELAGTLGLEGEALASVDLSWSPQTGITLDAEGSITVNPKFTFDVNAFARASLGIGWFSISETWRHNLVSFSWGPDIQFGIVFPVHYQEDQPFDISFDDIEVIYPDLDVIDMAKDLAGDIKDDIFD